VIDEAELVSVLRGQVAGRMATHAGAGPLPVAQRRHLVEQYTARVLDAHAHACVTGGQVPLSAQAEARIGRAIIDYLAGAGGLQALLDDKDVENIDVNGCDQVFIRYTDGTVVQGPPIADSDDELVDLIRSLASAVTFGDGRQGCR
jgi:Flp pilus assembly CpaF family ATPase